jgi:hypothetical protein
MRGRAPLVLAGVVALVIAVAWTTATTGASFTATSSNPSNTFATASSFPGIRVASGTYTGNGTDNRNITGVGFQPDVVIVKASTTEISVMRTSTMTGDNTKPLSGATNLQSNRIQALQSNGFQVGTDPQVNQGGGSPPTYYWIAFKSYTGHMALGTYTGNNTSQSITGLGFSPEYVMILGATNQPAVHRMTAMSSTFPFDSAGGGAVNGLGATNAITSLDANGFSLNSNDAVNDDPAGPSTTTYHYVAWNEDVDEMDTSSYTGNGAASRSITGVGFQPAYVIVRATNTSGTARQGLQKSTAVPDPASGFFSTTAATNTGITALQSGGFQVGNDANVNNNTTPYGYVAFKDKP